MSTLPVLVLNASYEALGVSSMKRATVLLWNGSAEIVTTYENSYERAGSWSTPSPSVIRLKKYVKVPQVRKPLLNRRSVMRRDNFLCAYCGKKGDNSDLTIDHIIPRSRGGTNTWGNVICCCFSCNQKKGDRTPKEMGWRLRFNPYEPKGNRRIAVMAKGNHPTWTEWLGE